MSTDLTIAAIQMDATPAPTAERLSRAARLLADAVGQGARLAVLPELFSIGYRYTPESFAAAERIDGPTATWMRRAAAESGCHIAGTLLLYERGEIYNTLLLIAPDGREWRYDKRYPCGWERAYFREGANRGVVADTDLGKIGLMVCWDTAHLRLWREYAGRVQLMVVPSCPPDITNPTYRLPSGAQPTLEDFGPLLASTRNTGGRLFGPMLDEQAAWLGVPLVNSVGAGTITTPVPQARATMQASALLSPRLRRYLAEAEHLQMSCDMIACGKVVDAHGKIVAQMDAHPADACAIGTVQIPDAPPRGLGAQPASRLPLGAYIGSDVLLPSLMRSTYRAGLRSLEQEP